MSEKIINLPAVPAGTPPELMEWVSAVTQSLELLQGLGRNRDIDRAIRIGELRRLGIDLLEFSLASQENPVELGGASAPSAKTPDPPTELVVTRGAFVHILQFVIPEDTIVSHIEVWVAKNSQVKTNAKKCFVLTIDPDDYGATVQVKLAVEDPTVDYTYWIRSISFAKNHSIWHPPDDQGGYVVPGDETIQDTIDGVIAILKGGAPAVYDPLTTYSQGERCQKSDGRVYTSKVDDNIGHEPPDATYWERTGILMTGEIDGVGSVAIDGNLVVDGTILARHIQSNTIKTNHMDASEVFVLTIQSSNYEAGVSGWKIDKDGNMEINGGSLVITDGLDYSKVSGATKPADNATRNTGDLADLDMIGLTFLDETIILAGKIATGLVVADSIYGRAITAEQIATGTLTAELIEANQIFVGHTLQSSNYEAGVSGWKLDQNGNLEMNGGSISITGGLDYSLISGTTAPDPNAQVNTIDSGDGLSVLDSTANTKLSGIETAATRNTGALADRNTVNGTYIDNNSITTGKLAANSVTAADILAYTITANRIKANNITTIVGGSGGQSASVTVTTPLAGKLTLLGSGDTPGTVTLKIGTSTKVSTAAATAQYYLASLSAGTYTFSVNGFTGNAYLSVIITYT